jgi:hypothetical protein
MTLQLVPGANCRCVLQHFRAWPVGAGLGAKFGREVTENGLIATQYSWAYSLPWDAKTDALSNPSPFFCRTGDRKSAPLSEPSLTPPRLHLGVRPQPQLRINIIMKTYFSGAQASSILGVWAAPGAPNPTPRGGALRAPPFVVVSGAPGAVQTPNVDDFWVPEEYVFCNYIDAKLGL